MGNFVDLKFFFLVLRVDLRSFRVDCMIFNLVFFIFEEKSRMKGGINIKDNLFGG